MWPFDQIGGMFSGGGFPAPPATPGFSMPPGFPAPPQIPGGFPGMPGPPGSWPQGVPNPFGLPSPGDMWNTVSGWFTNPYGNQGSVDNPSPWSGINPFGTQVSGGPKDMGVKMPSYSGDTSMQTSSHGFIPGAPRTDRSQWQNDVTTKTMPRGPLVNIHEGAMPPPPPTIDPNRHYGFGIFPK